MGEPPSSRRARAPQDTTDNELVYFESIHLFVELLDQFFGNVCELDLVFNFNKASMQTARMPAADTRRRRPPPPAAAARRRRRARPPRLTLRRALSRRCT